MTFLRRFLVLAAACWLGLGTTALADSGVSDERVSLPDGPGSIGGVGDNVDLDVNMGSMLYNVPIDVPEGFGTATPELGLSYSSAGGAGEVGVGWSMGISSIERMRLRGLPRYDETDEFAADGGNELIRVSPASTPSSSPLIYRARAERGFIRYQWYGRGATGSGGYWTAEYPDGTIAYYGADETAAHTPVRTARVETPAGGVYRYLLVARVDPFGHAIHYRYVKDGEWSLLDEITYVDSTGGPRFSVRFAYGARPDTISTGEPGFVLALTQRLREIQVRSGTEAIRRYLLTYEAETSSGGVSRLAGVETRGRADASSPIRFSFTYSRSLDGACSGSCAGPFMVDMGSLPAGVDLINGRSTLLDVNGDALPDILETSTTGRHTWVPTVLDLATGNPRFGAAYASTATPGATSFILGNPGVQVLDVNGDGFTDIIQSVTGAVLCNDGSGDWGGTACLMNSTLPTLSSDGAGDPNPLHVRFFDYDDDKRIDIIRTVTGSTEVFVNTGTAFVPQPVTDIGAVFDDSPSLQFADLNGDGLQDPVEILTGAGQLRFRINLGFGNWTAWQTVSLSGFGGADLDLLTLEDINGDGLADVVLVAGDLVRYAVNRNAATFAPAVTLGSADVEGDLPNRVPGITTVLFADMNGSGSRDIVWINAGNVRFLELFPVRPNLLSRVENGLGAVQSIEYGTTVLQQARDEATAPWAQALPIPMNVVVGMDTWNRLFADETTGLHDIATLSYRDGYYDGVERAFRGFGHVERIETSDIASDGQVGARTVFDYDLGLTDTERHGLILRSQRFGGAPGAWSPVFEERTTWSDCPVAEVPAGLARPVRWICETRRDQIVQEGAPSAQWRTARTERAYDGYGGTTLATNHGVVHLGPPESPTGCGACAPGVGPCGAECTGDEEYVETTYITPGTATSGAWILGRPVRRRTYGEVGGLETEEVTRYDGPDFVGLPEGQLTRGLVTSARARVDATTFIDTQRVRYDAHGNIVEEIGPDGAIEMSDRHRRRLTYDDLGIRIARIEDLFVDASGAAASLRREYTYESAFYEVSESTAWMLVRGGSPVTARNAERYRYDAFGRPAAVLMVGDTDVTPTDEYTYELASPVSRVVTRSRTVMGGPLDHETIQCLDGSGRDVQTRTRLTDGSYQVSGFQVLNRRGSAVRVYDEHLSASGACDMTAPTGVPYETFEYDALDRLVENTEPSESVHGSRSVLRVEHAPLQTIRYDAEDNDATGQYAGTPLTETFDGLDRLVAMTRELGGGVTATTTLEYDSLGRLITVTAPDGVSHTQTYDLLDRVLTSTDPDRGLLRFAYDASGHVVGRTDARGERSIAEYDGVGRLVAQWDPTAEAATRAELIYDEDPSCTDCDNGARRLVSIRYPLGELGEGLDQVGYDARGNAVLEARTLGGFRFVSRHTYDAVGRRTRSEYPGGLGFDRTYDQGSRPTGIGGIVDDIGYDAQGRISTLFYANGTRTERGYDDLGRIEGIETISGGSVLQGISMERDRVGNITSISDTSEPAMPRPSLSGRFTYDAWYRLRQATFGEVGGTLETLDYAYDSGDRVTSVVSSLGAASRAHVGTIEYDTTHPNAVRRAGGIEYAYDASGRVTQRGTTGLAYDYGGRLASSNDESGDTTGRFFYGTSSLRVARIENGSVTYYLGDECQIRDGIVSVYPQLERWRLARLRTESIQTDVLTDVAPLDASDGEINAADAWVSVATEAGIVDGAPDASDAMWLLSGAARRLLTQDGGDLAYLHQDHLGSTTLSTDDDGTLAGETLFYPSGEVRHHSGFVDEHGFSSQEIDASTGLLAFQFRLLDTEVGRWTSPDPAFDTVSPDSVQRLGESMTGYAYVANQYGNAIDPLGLAAEAAAKSPSRLARAGAALGRAGRAVGGAAYAVVAAPFRAVAAVGRGTAAFLRAPGATLRAFATAHPGVVGLLKAVGKIAIGAAIGFALGGPIGAAAAAIVGVGGALLGAGVSTLISRTRAGRAIGRTIGRGWNRLNDSTAGKILKGALIVGAIAAAITVTALGGPPVVGEAGTLIAWTPSTFTNAGIGVVVSLVGASTGVLATDRATGSETR